MFLENYYLPQITFSFRFNSQVHLMGKNEAHHYRNALGRRLGGNQGSYKVSVWI